MNSPLVTVVIPTYNRIKVLARAIDSVLSQTYTNWELFIVDDGSTDSTLDFLKINYLSNNRIYYLRRPEERWKGANSCRNIGAEEGSGKYVAYLDSDDEWHPKHLKTKIMKLEESNAKFIFGSYLVEQNNSFKYFKCITKEDRGIDYYLAEEGDVRTSTFVIEKSALLKIKFDEELEKHQDWDFALRFCSEFKYLVDESFNVTLHYEEQRMSDALNHKATFRFLDRHIKKLNSKALEKIVTTVGFVTFRNEGCSEIFQKYAKILRENKSMTSKISLSVGYIFPIPWIGSLWFKLIESYRNFQWTIKLRQ